MSDEQRKDQENFESNASASSETQPVVQSAAMPAQSSQDASNYVPVYPGQSTAGTYPPAGSYQSNAAYVTPAPQESAALQELTGGAKFGWLVVGFLMGPVGILLAWLVYLDKVNEVKKSAIKFSLIGFIICFAAAILFSGMVACAVVSTAASMSYPYGHYGW